MGGGNDSRVHNNFDNDLPRSAELYDPVTRTLVPTASLSSDRVGHLVGGSAQLLDGRVLVASHRPAGSQADIYDPMTESWSAGPNLPFDNLTWPTFTWTLRFADGRVMMGGIHTTKDMIFEPDPSDPLGGRWLSVGSCGCIDAQLLPDGTVLGIEYQGGRKTSVFDPATLKWNRVDTAQVPIGNLAVISGTAAQCGARCGRVLGAGGSGSKGAAELYGDHTLSVRVTGVSPRAGFSCGGQAVTISGVGFTDATAVNFGDVSVPRADFITVNGDGTAITVKSPRHLPGDFNVTVTAPVGSESVTSAVSAEAVYTYNPAEPATIGSLSPPLGPVLGGTKVSVVGSFAPECVRSVSFGEVPARYSADNAEPGEFAETMTATSPAHKAGRVPVRVDTDLGPPEPPGKVPSVAASPDADLFSFHPVISGLFPPHRAHRRGQPGHHRRGRLRQ